LRPVRRIFRWWLSPELIIGLFPIWYATPQPDWPRQLQLAGFGRFDGAKEEMPEEVRRFCEGGSPPIAITLGTGMMHSAEFFRTAVAACAKAGARGLLLSKFAETIPSALPSTVRHFPFAPFRPLLPLCGAIVHHGGVGTTAAALQAGCPQLVLPLAWDQPDNAARVKELGAGLSLGPRERSAGDLSMALAQLLSAGFRDRCRQIANETRTEDGLEVAAGLVEGMGANDGSSKQ
jgi:UDP:flavonoid glycosyltransferase YjiC (YdhE family)